MNYSNYDYSNSRLIEIGDFNNLKRPVLLPNGNYVIPTRSIGNNNLTVYGRDGGLVSTLVDADYCSNGCIALRDGNILTYHPNGFIKFWDAKNKEGSLIREVFLSNQTILSQNGVDVVVETHHPINDIRDALEMPDGTLVVIQCPKMRSEKILFLDSSGRKKFEYYLGRCKTFNKSTKLIFEPTWSSYLFVWRNKNKLFEIDTRSIALPEQTSIVKRVEQDTNSHPLKRRLFYQFCRCKEKIICGAACKSCKRPSVLHEKNNLIRWILPLRDGSLLYQTKTNQVLIWNPSADSLERVMNWKQELRTVVKMKNGTMVDNFEWVEEPCAMMIFDSVHEMGNGLLVGYSEEIPLLGIKYPRLTFFDRKRILHTFELSSKCWGTFPLGDQIDKIGLVTGEGLRICDILYRFGISCFFFFLGIFIKKKKKTKQRNKNLVHMCCFEIARTVSKGELEDLLPCELLELCESFRGGKLLLSR